MDTVMTYQFPSCTQPLCAVALAAAASCCALPAVAQSANFEGFHLSAATGWNTTQYKTSNFSPATYSADEITASGAPLVFGLEYTWAMDSQYTLGVVLDANVVQSSTASGRITNSGVYADGQTLKLKNSTQLSIVPGVAINNDQLLYLKFGYYSLNTNAVADASGASTDGTYNGYSLGIGLKKMYGSQLFVFGELNARTGIDKDESSGDRSYKTNMAGSSLLVGVGYRF